MTDDAAYDDLVGMLADAGSSFVTLVIALEPDDWAKPGLGEWTVRELVGHTIRAFSTVDRFLDNPSETADVADSATYYRVALGSLPDVHASVAERGREAGIALGDDPVEAVVEQVSATMGRLGDTTGNEIGVTAVGGMRLADYLETRLVELVVHGLDLASAVGRPVDFGAAAVRAATTVFSSATPQDRDIVLRSMLGRTALPAGFNVWP